MDWTHIDSDPKWQSLFQSNRVRKKVEDAVYALTGGEEMGDEKRGYLKGYLAAIHYIKTLPEQERAFILKQENRDLPLEQQRRPRPNEIVENFRDWIRSIYDRARESRLFPQLTDPSRRKGTGRPRAEER